MAAYRTCKHRLLMLVLPLLLLAGCASAPPERPTSLADADAAIEAAEKLDASHYAAAELDEARQKLEAAGKAFDADDPILADRLGQQAVATAELASARTEATKAAAINADMERSTQALTEEMQRRNRR